MNNEMAIYAGKEKSFPVLCCPGRRQKSDFVKKCMFLAPKCMDSVSAGCYHYHIEIRAVKSNRSL